MKALIGKKIGMTHIFTPEGTQVPVTVLDVSGVKVAKHLKQGEKSTHVEIAVGNTKKAIKSDIGNYKELGHVPSHKVMLKLSDADQAELESLAVGAELTADMFAKGDKVDIVGKTKGKGFQGVVKRYGFAGGVATHGQSDRHRAPGSIGSGTTLGRVYKGTKMAGHMGDKRKTVSNLQIAEVDMENKLILVAGSIPGRNGSMVLIRKAIKSK